MTTPRRPESLFAFWLTRLLGFYQRWLSPALHTLFPGGCRFHPTCSQYAVEAIAIHGAARGSWLGMRRLLRCHPFARGGFDPVPLPSSPARSTRVSEPLSAAIDTCGERKPLP